MFCPKCGNELADDAKFCGACGYNMNDAGAQPEAKTPDQEGAASEGDGQKGTFWVEDEKPQPEQNAASGDQASAGAGAWNANANDAGAQGGGAQYGYGTPNGQAAGGAYGGAPNAGSMPDGGNDKQSKMIGLAIVGVAAIVVIVLLVLLIKALFGGGYESKLDDAVDLVNDRCTELDDYVEIALPGFVADAYHDLMDIAEDEGEDDFEDALDNARDALENMYDELEDEYGKDFEVSYEIKKEKELDDDDLEDIEDTYKDLADEIPLDDLEDELDSAGDAAEDLYKVVEDLVDELKDVNVSAGYKVDLELTIEGDEDDDTQEVTVTFIKMNGDWTIDYSEYMSTLMYGLGGLGF